ncbi:MAG: hypothetical protein AB7O88_28475 [Reyranellaceae bacterium]
MTRDEAAEHLAAANTAIATAVMLIRCEIDTINRFFEEKEHMASIGPIIDPTLFNSSERRAMEALLSPVYEAARDLVGAYDRQNALARDTLAKVRR